VIGARIDADPSFLRRRAAADAGLTSVLAFPAMAPHGPITVLSFYGFGGRVPSDRLIRTLAAIGSELGRFLAARRGELGPRRLSERELQILRLAADGAAGPKIAERLTISPATVKSHFENIYEKLGVPDRTAAVARALRLGLIR
jgi:DNA-binding CsgD family transcriptional regulator